MITTTRRDLLQQITRLSELAPEMRLGQLIASLAAMDGTPWDEKYHIVKITRDGSGAANVYFDDKLMMTTDRKELPAGKLGFGSFDDIGNFAEVTVWGKKAESQR